MRSAAQIDESLAAATLDKAFDHLFRNADPVAQLLPFFTLPYLARISEYLWNLSLIRATKHARTQQTSGRVCGKSSRRMQNS